VAHHEWRDAAPRAAVHAMYIAAADAACLYGDQYLAWGKEWLGDVSIDKPIVFGE